MVFQFLNMTLMAIVRKATSAFFTIMLLLIIIFPTTMLSAEENKEIVIADFTHSGITQWQQEHFEGKTIYRIVNLDGESVLSATANASASVLYKNVEIDVSKTPYLNWSWRVENIHDLDDPLIEKGDDYPARVYIVVKVGFFPWQTKALNYVWCNKKTKLKYWANPFTDKAIMIPVRCGSEGLKHWQQERVNIVEDYYRVFKQRLTKIHGIAIMTDADNSKGKASAYYKKISLSD